MIKIAAVQAPPACTLIAEAGLRDIATASMSTSTTVRCPGCRSAMQTLALEAVLGKMIDVHACLRCRAFWFEPFETLHLTRGSTAKLFKLIADQTAGTAPFPESCYCPMCNANLLLTHDRQQNTPFQYWRCDAGHGRFTSFVDFLREKDFIRPLSPQQIAELRQKIQIINCSNCGAPVDLTRDSSCGHCGSPLSMLDTKKMVEMAKGAGETPRPLQTAAPVHEHGDIAALLASYESRSPNQPASSFSLVELGLAAVVRWLRDLSE